MLDINKKNKITHHINSTVILILFFCLFSIFYLINFDKYNFFSLLILELLINLMEL